MDDATTLTVCTPTGGPLPVSLTDFKGRLNQTIANLSWTTAQELNVQKFEIERSIDGIKFSVLNSVEAGRLNQSVYQYNDISVPVSSIIYYRLRVVDNNGSYKYSSIIVLKMNDQIKETTVYPAPFRDRISINTYAEGKGKIAVVLTDAAGRKITEKISAVESGSNTITLTNLDKLQKGLYFVRIYNNDKLTATKRAVKIQ